MNFKKSETAFSLMGFLPALVVQYLMEKQSSTQLPSKQTFRSVVMFADISGFTNLTETLAKIGSEGCELTAFAINRYMELLVAAVSRSGGDIFKFAGDAIIVVWPPSTKDTEVERNEELNMICRQAIQSALDIRTKLAHTNILENIKLSVKIGQKYAIFFYNSFGIGEICIIYVGGVFGRCEYLATGDPLTQAFQSEHQCTEGGQTFVSKEVHDLMKDFFVMEEMHDHHYDKKFYKVIRLDGHFKVKMKADALLIKNQISLIQFERIKNQVLKYIPAALVPYIEIEQEQWSSELRRITVLFINLGIDLGDAQNSHGLQRIQRVIETVQKCVYFHEGSLNKVLMDDKGSTLIVCFGLPPLMHQDDASRAVLTAFMLVDQLKLIDCKCRVGIATGKVFTGVVGTSGSRREYSVLGDAVNLAARLMQLAITNEQGKIILISQETSRNCQNKIISKHWRDVQLKGKQHLVPVYEAINIAEITKFVSMKSLEQQLGPLYQLRTHFSWDEQKLFNIQKENEGKIYKVLKDWLAKCQLKPKIQKTDKSNITSNSEDSDQEENRILIIIKGNFGIGKSQFAKCILQDIEMNHGFQYKYKERLHIIISSLDPVSKTLKFNGIRQVLKEVFLLACNRIRQPPSDKILKEMINFNEECEGQFNAFQEVVGLVDYNILDQFPSKPKQADEERYRIEKKVLARMVVSLFQYFLEEQPLNTKLSDYQRQKYIPIPSAPLLICFDDFQYYDEISLYLIKVILKNFTKIQVMALVRDQFWDLPYISKENRFPNRIQMQIQETGLSEIQNIMHVNTLTIQLNGLKVQDISEFLCTQLNITNIIGDDMNLQIESRLRNLTRQISQGSKIKIEQGYISDHLLFFECKNKIHNSYFKYLVEVYIYLKCKGHQLIMINLINNLISQGMLQINGDGLAQVNWRFMEILIHDQWLSVDAPMSCIQMNSTIIDRLTCFELLILKFASVIGDIFDIQTLYKILDFKDQITPDKFLKIIKDLDSVDIIELMDSSGQNQHYRFVNPFFREVIYQRMTFAQRRQIHVSVAISSQLIPQTQDYDEDRDLKQIEFHWLVSETKAQITTQPKNNNHKNNFSINARRSIIVKKIQCQLMKNNFDPSTQLKQGILCKRSEKGVYWINRYIVLDSKEIKIYDNEQSISKPSGIIRLNQITEIAANIQQQRPYTVKLRVSSWVKGISEESRREFYFDCLTENELDEWIIYLEFCKSKSIYDGFIENFGKISFPINLRIDAYDNSLIMELTQQYRQVGLNITGRRNIPSALRLIQRQSRQSKIPLSNKTIQQSFKSILNVNNQYVSKQTLRDMEESNDDDKKYQLKYFIQKSLLLLIIHLVTHQNETQNLQLGQTGKYITKNIRFFDLKFLKKSINLRFNKSVIINE